MFASLLQAFAHQVATHSDETALIAKDGDAVIRCSWNELAAKAIACGDRINTLLDQNQDTPRRVGYLSHNSESDVVRILGCMIAGVIEVPVDHRFPESRVSELFDQVGGVWLDGEEPFKKTESSTDRLSILESCCRSIDADEASLILWTSGTTSSPKGVVLSHRNLCGNAMAKLKAVPQKRTDVRLTSLPLCHGYARTSDFGTWLLSGCTLAIGIGFDAWRTLGPITRPSVANVVPRLAKRLFNADPDIVGTGRLRLLGCGGAPLSVSEFQAWREKGVTVIQGYGLTETSPVICSATPENATPGLVGDFVDGWEYQIRNGVLYVRGPHVMLGYWSDQKSTSERMDESGWLNTGDIVEQDSETGQCRILGRVDDVIVLTDGHKVNPMEVEREIERLPEVNHALLLSVDDNLVLWIDADRSFRSQESRQRIQSALEHRPRWEQPQAIRFFESPLRQQNGELTAKLTIRRRYTIKQRALEGRSQVTS